MKYQVEIKCVTKDGSLKTIFEGRIESLRAIFQVMDSLSQHTDEQEKLIYHIYEC